MLRDRMKLRFAPSPTGFLHVGGARTAIFNLLHARHFGGRMLLRIEDTDVERSKQHHAEQIVSSLQWLGVAWDEGPVYQSDRLDRYRERAEELIASAKAYRCYCTVEELDAERTAAESAGTAYRYSGKCRRRAEAGEPQPDDAPHVIRFKVGSGAIEFHDLIRGDVRFEAELIDDFVLIRSDDHPTYHLSVVVDDIDMEITHVARGDDHLSNTPKHILLFRAFGASVPSFAHLPLILGGDRKRLSKRTGATSAEEYRDMGIVPQALFNFLTLLGWNPGGDRELISFDEAAQLFDLADVNKAPAVFDPEKLLWMNGQYLMRMSADEIHPHLVPFLGDDPRPLEELRAVIELNKSRARTLKELAELMTPFFTDDASIDYDADAVKKHLKGDDLAGRLRELHDTLAATEPFDVATSEAALRALAEARGVSAAKLIHPLRLALTGRGASPPIFDVAVVLGKERTLRRLQRLIERLPSLV
ncbi:MAG: glutamate--tRNA ligase [Acidobacteria bacterium]|nr:glutamate--tRNA ligase [Acidobacteriota bacterium]MBV9475886.1 glutamate--tRNA ligase [Acidobacteriota bacterium]